jgi:hypothetical protein
MASADFKQVEPLIKELSPPEEVKKSFYQTFFGSLVGQTYFFMGLLAVYLAVVAFLYSYAKAPLQAFLDDLGAFWFWGILATPLICILLFQMLPTALRALREKRLKAVAIGGVPKPGYFRLQPYGASDHYDFKRLDGADRVVLNWLKSTKSSLLYLSGASGVGKSSLLAAGVLPPLRDAGWSVVETRLFGDPVEHLRTALLDAKGIFKRKPANTPSLTDLLRSAAEATARTHTAPLLLVIDQFEEFLILHDEVTHSAFASLLSDLTKSPIDGLKLLLVFRSDYRSLVFKLDLPSLAPGDNWYEISPYNRSEAASMLQGAGRELSPDALDKLFRGLDRIEDAPGLYRPITLNMIGLVLEDMGGTLSSDPSKLIQTYLMNSLTAGTSRDFAKPLLAKMITDAGTKEPHSEAELVNRTHFALWQVRATLAELAGRGLVRRLEGLGATWEIAHDFLARAIGQLIGRLKPTLIGRVRPLVAPVVLLGWAVAFAAAVPFWKVSHRQAVEKALREQFGASIGAAEPPRIAVSLWYVDDSKLASAIPLLEQLDEMVTLGIQTSPATSLEPLKNLPKLQGLDLYDTGITSLEPLKNLPNLSWLRLTANDGITSLEPLKGLPKLSNLGLHITTSRASLEPLKDMTNLSSLGLDNTRIASLEPLGGMTNLSSLSLINTSIASLEPLKSLPNLSYLNLAANEGITSLEPLRGMTKLSTIVLDYTGITSLEPLTGMSNLSYLSITNTSITSLEPLKSLPKLSNLRLGDTRITTLEPLKGMKVEVVGASEQLLSTMR